MDIYAQSMGEKPDKASSLLHLFTPLSFIPESSFFAVHYSLSRFVVLAS
jgi:hypothetical protein